MIGLKNRAGKSTAIQPRDVQTAALNAFKSLRAERPAAMVKLNVSVEQPDGTTTQRQLTPDEFVTWLRDFGHFGLRLPQRSGLTLLASMLAEQYSTAYPTSTIWIVTPTAADLDLIPFHSSLRLFSSYEEMLQMQGERPHLLIIDNVDWIAKADPTLLEARKRIAQTEHSWLVTLSS